MKLADLQALAEDRLRLGRATKLANELARLDAKRAGIIAELRTLGIEPEGTAPEPITVQHARGTPAFPTEITRERTPSHTGGAASNGAAPHAAPLTREAARERAIDLVIGGRIAVDGDMAHDPDDAEKRYRERRAELAARHAPEIARMTDDLLAGPAPEPLCADCGEPATTAIAGADYCAEHADRHRLPRPDFAARANGAGR